MTNDRRVEWEDAQGAKHFMAPEAAEEALKQFYDAWPGGLPEVESALASLKDDAENYRWLRKQHWHNGELCVVQNPKGTVRLGTNCPSAEQLDKLIKEAREKENGS